MTTHSDAMMPFDADFYVAVDGDDSWTGRHSEPIPGGDDGPFATLSRARDAVRELRAREPDRDLQVLIRGGTYRLRETLVFDLRDSSAKGTTTYAAYPGERPVLCPDVPIRGWQKLEEDPAELPPGARGQLWIADLPDEAPDRFFTLYNGATRLPRARSQGFLPQNPTGLDIKPSRRELYFPPGTLKAWSNLDDIEILIRPSYAWILNILPLESVDEEAGVARTALPGTYPLIRPHHFIDTIREACWVENVFEALDTPGNWVLDSKERKLYLWPTGDTPGDEIVAPCLRELMRVEGDIDRKAPEDIPVQGLVFRGLTFTRGDRDRWTERDAGLQHDWELHDKDNALVRLRGAERCRIETCRFTKSGGTAIRLDLHCQHNHVIGNMIDHVGGTGILLCGYGAGTKDVNKHNVISNNHIHHCGEIYWHAMGIFVWQSGENQIVHNLIHHTGYDAIVLSGLRPNLFKTPWFPVEADASGGDRPMFTGDAATNPRESGTIRRQEVGSVEAWRRRLDEIDLGTAAGFATYMKFVRPFFHTRGNRVEDNEIHHVMMRLGDGNAIYLSDVGRDNVIHHNYIHDLTGKGGQSAIRTDAFMTDTWITENVIYHCNCGGLNLKYYGNHAFNNFVIDIPDTEDIDIHGNPVTLSFGYISIGDVFPKEDMPSNASVQIHRNVIYKTDTRHPFYREYRRDDQWVELGVENCEIDHNLYYAPEEPDEGRSHLNRYRELGVDHRSALGDPCFVAPDRDDFGFCGESRARALGIKPIDTSDIGLTESLPHFEDISA